MPCYTCCVLYYVTALMLALHGTCIPCHVCSLAWHFGRDNITLAGANHSRSATPVACAVRCLRPCFSRPSLALVSDLAGRAPSPPASCPVGSSGLGLGWTDGFSWLAGACLLLTPCHAPGFNGRHQTLTTPTGSRVLSGLALPTRHQNHSNFCVPFSQSDTFLVVQIQ